MLSLAIVVAGVSIPLTALIWQAGHLRRRLVWHTNQMEARREEYAAEHKLWESAVSAAPSKADLANLTADVVLLQARVLKLENERGLAALKRTA